VTDASVEKISLALKSLKTLNLSYCERLADQTLSHLKRLPLLEDLDISSNRAYSLHASYSFLEATKSRLKIFKSSWMSECAYDAFVEPPARILNWAVRTLTDSDVSFLVEKLGDDRCSKIREFAPSFSSITENSVMLILTKMKNLTKLTLHNCTKIHFEKLQFDNNNNNTSAVDTILPKLTEFDASCSEIDDVGVEKIVSAFPGLRKVNLGRSQRIGDACLETLKRLQNLEEIVFGEVDFTTSALHDFVMSKRSTLKKLFQWSSYGIFAGDFLADQSLTVLRWSSSHERPELNDEEVRCLFELIEDEKCLEIETIDLTNNSQYFSEVSLDLISEKCLNLKKIILWRCDNILTGYSDNILIITRMTIFYDK
jgi:hypothetical protein